MIEVVILVISIVGSLILAVLALATNRQSATNRLFAKLVGATTIWLITTYFALKVPPPYDIQLVRLTMALAVIQIYYLFHFVHTFPKAKQSLSNTWQKFSRIGGLIVAAIAVSPFMFTDLVNGQTVAGPGIIAFLLFAASHVGSALFILIKKFRHSSGSLRSQLRFLTLGIVISFGLIALTNLGLVIFLGNASIVSLTPFYTLILFGCIAYAIFVHHLFDIRIFVRRTVIFSVLVAFAFLTYTLVVYIATALLGTRSSQLAASGPNIFIDLITIIIVAFSYEPIKVWLSEKTDRWLFKKEYEQEVVIKELSQKLNNVIALDEALEAVMQTTAKALHLHHAVTYVFQQADKGEQAIKRIKQIGYATTQRLILEERDFVMTYFCKHPKILFTEELLLELSRERSLLEAKKTPDSYTSQAEFIRTHAIKAAVAKKLEQLEVAVAMPLNLKDQPLGLVLLSSKQSNEGYSKQDLTLLELVGDQAISSIQKAKLYEGDQMKSEFVSIASHELLTPISAIEGYLSMILDEKIAGKGLDPQTTDYLSKCFSSAKRLSMLVKDLLSVSRIESGKMKFTAQQLDSTKSIQDTIDQLRFIAEEKKITLKFKKPDPAHPPVLADPDRTSQVLINLVSNAIKYNRPGGQVEVTSELLKRERMISITVKDNGLGMDKEQMSHLFEKFYRVDSKETVGIIGTGLGLYITKSIVERMGGAITVQSTAGKGTSFTFTLPLLEVEKSSAT